jgi:hypothetical protein
MVRTAINLRECGINLDREAFVGMLLDDFSAAYSNCLSFGELLLHPRLALQFCESVRQRHGYADLPDDVILRWLGSGERIRPLKAGVQE